MDETEKELHDNVQVSAWLLEGWGTINHTGRGGEAG